LVVLLSDAIWQDFERVRSAVVAHKPFERFFQRRAVMEWPSSDRVPPSDAYKKLDTVTFPW
jgi:hypothetical protein